MADCRGSTILNDIQTIKAVHTVIWVFLAACVLAIPVLGWAELYRSVAWLTGIVLLETLVLVFNGWQCPLTGMAAQHTDDRRANFDIYLPEWLARHNKVIFGSIFIAGEVFVAFRWLGILE